MPWLVKLYLLGLFLSVFSALFGLVDFLGDLMPLQGLDPWLSGHWAGSEDGQSPGGRCQDQQSPRLLRLTA